MSPNAFNYWKSSSLATYQDSSIVFVRKNTVPKAYLHYLSSCSDLKGFVQSSAFCRYIGLAPSLLIFSNKSQFKNFVKIKQIGRCKLVDLNDFYARFNLSKEKYIYVDKCKNFSALEKKIKITKVLCLGYY